MSVLAPLRQWLFQLKPDESLPVILTQRRIFILPTGTGILFCVVLGLMLIGSINYNLSLGHALVFLLAGIGMVAMVHTFRNLVNLRLTPGRADPVFAGETAYFQVVLENTQQQARRSLDFSFANNPGVSLSIPVEGRAAIDIPCPAPKRGRLDPGRIILATRYPLGLFRAWSYPHPRLSCLVYPKPIEAELPAPSPLLSRGQYHGQHGQEDFTGLRPRQPNDSPRHIAWKAVARDIENRPLLIKQFAGGNDEMLWLDWSQFADEVDSETRLSVLTGWIIAADRGQLRYGLRLPDREFSPQQGSAHRDSCLEALALYDEAD